jgi:hypothetical protein
MDERTIQSYDGNIGIVSYGPHDFFHLRYKGVSIEDDDLFL